MRDVGEVAFRCWSRGRTLSEIVMRNCSPMRASDSERETAVDLLSQAFAEGRLSHHELEQRSAAALTARTRGELSALTADLPLPGAHTGLPAHPVTGPRRIPAHSTPSQAPSYAVTARPISPVC